MGRGRAFASVTGYRRERTSRLHARSLTANLGPSGFLLSRTATVPALAAASTQLPPLELVRLDLRRLNARA